MHSSICISDLGEVALEKQKFIPPPLLWWVFLRSMFVCNCSFLVVDGSVVGRGFHSFILCSPVKEDVARLFLGCLP